MNPPTRNNAGALLSGPAVLRDQPELFGPVASTPTAWRVVERPASDPDGLARLRAARAHARGCAWAAGGDPDVEVLIVDADATLVLAQTDAKEGAAGTYKGSFGFAPLLAYLDRGQAPASRHRGADDRGAVGGLLRLEVWGGGVAGGARQGPDRGWGCWCPCEGRSVSRRDYWPAWCASTWSTSGEEARRRLLIGIDQSGAGPTSAPLPGEARTAKRFPGQGPEIANLPARNRNFSGREELLEDLHARLQDESAAAVVPTGAVHGLGGWARPSWPWTRVPQFVGTRVWSLG
jgi:hypothetical protein